MMYYSTNYSVLITILNLKSFFSYIYKNIKLQINGIVYGFKYGLIFFPPIIQMFLKYLLRYVFVKCEQAQSNLYDSNLKSSK